MKQGIILLSLWFVIAGLLGGMFVPPIPPGGVAWPYFLFVFSVPVGALFYARFDKRIVVPICYGILTGVWFALPIFYDDRAVSAGIVTVGRVGLRLALSALTMSLLCSLAFVLGCRAFGSNETKVGEHLQ